MMCVLFPAPDVRVPYGGCVCVSVCDIVLLWFWFGEEKSSAKDRREIQTQLAVNRFETCYTNAFPPHFHPI